MLNLEELIIRETTYEEYKVFTSKLIDKVQLAESNSVLFLKGNNLIAIKVPSKVLGKLGRFVKDNNFSKVDIDEFNKAVIKDKEGLKIDLDYYKGKNFIVK